MCPIHLSIVIPNASAEDISFLYKLLKLDPKQRSSAAECLATPYMICRLTNAFHICSKENNAVGLLADVKKDISNVEDFLENVVEKIMRQ